MSLEGSQWLATRFYKNLRRLNDRRFVSKRQLLGLYFDLYELLMALSEENRKDDFLEQLMPPPGGLKMFKMSPEDFDEVVKRDKEYSKKREEKEDAKPHGGQYL